MMFEALSIPSREREGRAFISALLMLRCDMQQLRRGAAPVCVLLPFVIGTTKERKDEAMSSGEMVMDSPTTTNCNLNFSSPDLNDTYKSAWEPKNTLIHGTGAHHFTDVFLVKTG